MHRFYSPPRGALALRVDDRLAGQDAPQGPNQLLAASVLEDISVDPRSQRLEDVVVLAVHRQQDQASPWGAKANFLGRVQSIQEAAIRVISRKGMAAGLRTLPTT